MSRLKEDFVFLEAKNPPAARLRIKKIYITSVPLGALCEEITLKLDLGLVNRGVPRDQLDAEVMEYAATVAENDPFQLRMIKLAVNGAQDAQGFNQHITAAHSSFLLSSQGEKDPDYALATPSGSRRPMVQQAMAKYEAARKGERDKG